MKKYLVILIIICFITSVSKAQSGSIGKSQFLVGWEVASPTGTNFVNKTSYRGATLQYRYMVKPNLAIGATVSWNSFEEYVERKTYYAPDNGSAITTDMDRFVYVFPVTIDGYYYFQNTGKLKPYAGLSLGTEYSDQTAYFNIYGIQDTNWGFLVRPQVGLLIPFNSTVGAFVGATYNYATNSNDSFKIDNLQHLGVQIGLVFSTR
ncbi:outer membrane beta-barrel protein [Pedobacter sp. HMF7647]|uniref:Outer membrane beta-barrel protein n=1 Tax=Hufsiella arboris TaxID=2695275 RepID=A0A7K1YFP8_9SPHI|nr:outer membrane beta-barrel protein [Hufsiella arboris]MXV53251.1 outer membrane beta-barrel protein [Hufsiella arboris]